MMDVSYWFHGSVHGVNTAGRGRSPWCGWELLNMYQEERRPRCLWGWLHPTGRGLCFLELLPSTWKSISPHPILPVFFLLILPALFLFSPLPYFLFLSSLFPFPVFLLSFLFPVLSLPSPSSSSSSSLSFSSFSFFFISLPASVRKVSQPVQASSQHPSLGGVTHRILTHALGCLNIAQEDHPDLAIYKLCDLGQFPSSP